MNALQPPAMHTLEMEPQAWERLDYRLLGLYHRQVRKDTRHLISTMPHYVLWRLDAGHVRLRLPQAPDLVATAGTWVLIPPDYPREHIFSDDAVILSLHLWAGWLGHRPLLSVPGLLVRPVEAWPELGQAAESLLRDNPLRRSVRLESFAAWEGARWRWLAAFFRTLRGEGCEPMPWFVRDERVARAIEILEDLDHVPRLPYHRLGEATGLSRAHLDRLFLAHLQKTPRQVHDEILGRRASALLVGGEMPLKRIAAELGFPAPAQFNRWFKRVSGMTPGIYRKRMT